ncbi:protein kinase C and casein kinase substrate in neurons protein 1-like isoform X2 [Haliotis rubra]|uniref:protein kinase C and casein kinase substrate in neurons protein 1-like isoform X2 n=1 Tax=Haliotis rubra TaxID=36100 RepID=UPI001EE5E7C7|nr:protein kinase C and casein kinase substrate in neurons protein 1-like isoform X2 [Haliotis rubra]
MSVTEEVVMPTSDSFWELGKFMKTVKRCDNGYKLCDSLRQLVEQRSEIEKKYAKDLVQWAKKWNNFLDNGAEYGTMQGAWRGLLCEADSLSDLHTLIGDRLMSEVYHSVKIWQKENYHKSMMHFKETKEFEDSFRKAQKPWGKKLTKVLTARKDYHNVCRQEKSTANQENNARADTAVSPDQLKKLQEKLRKLQEEVNVTRDKYQASLNDLNSYNAKYMEDMTEVYEKCQNFERMRIDFLKKTMFQMHSCLDLSVDSRYAKLYTDLHSTIGNTDPDMDLKWWSTNSGVDMAMNWPAFEEYSPELQSISKRGKSQIGSGDGITITRIRHNRESSYENYGSDHAQPPSYNTLPTTQTRANDTNIAAATVTPPPPSMPAAPVTDDYNGGASNPFGEAASDDDQSVEDDPATDRGVAVKAIYDYVKTEDDEFSFKTGDVFVKLTDEDEMGWCRGRKDGDIGLFPANYVVPL